MLSADAAAYLCGFPAAFRSGDRLTAAPRSRRASQARAEVLQLHAGGGMVQGRMSMAGAAHQNWRQDYIAWLTPARCDALPSLAALDAKLQALSEALNAELVARQHMRLGGRHDCQLSLYPGSGAGGFKRHADTKDIHTSGRKLTMLLYLNPPGWNAGGALRIYGQGGDVADIAPLGGTVVVLRSDIQHEVLPTAGPPRTAMTVWFDGVLMPQHPLCAAKGGASAAAPRSSLSMEGLNILDDACSDFDDDAEALVARPLGAESGDLRDEPPSPPAAGCGGGAPGRRRRRWWPFPFGAKA